MPAHGEMPTGAGGHVRADQGQISAERMEKDIMGWGRVMTGTVIMPRKEQDQQCQCILYPIPFPRPDLPILRKVVHETHHHMTYINPSVWGLGWDSNREQE